MKGIIIMKIDKVMLEMHACIYEDMKKYANISFIFKKGKMLDIIEGHNIKVVLSASALRTIEALGRMNNDSVLDTEREYRLYGWCLSYEKSGKKVNFLSVAFID